MHRFISVVLMLDVVTWSALAWSSVPVCMFLPPSHFYVDYGDIVYGKQMQQRTIKCLHMLPVDSSTECCCILLEAYILDVVYLVFP